MDSDDDLHDVYDSDYGDYSEGEWGEDIQGDNHDDDDEDGDHDQFIEESVVPCEKGYTILKEEDIRQLQEEDINYVSAVLSINRAEGIILLRHYQWNTSRLEDEWFSDDGKVRRAVGLLAGPGTPSTLDVEITCGICFESQPLASMYSASCGHPFCLTCWRAYVSISISEGPGCLLLRCPEPSCTAAIGEDIIDRLASDEEKEKYSSFSVRSYVEDKKKIKWCPAPGCDYAIEFDLSSGIFDVTCNCSHSFCWNCTEETHRPIDCSTVSKWIIKNSAESENVTWILANSKPCPKCKRPIEKNHGCMHMTCRQPCKFEFCWLCLGAWKDHGQRTGRCNGYNTANLGTKFAEDERIREMAKKSLEKYTHYYERWASNQKSRVKALQDLQQMQDVNLKKLSDNQKTPETQLKFIIEAWQQIIECRQVLKWTYAYGYYLPEHEIVKKGFFEYLQGEAEAHLERLHRCAEKELEDFLGDDPKKLSFQSFRCKLAGLTSVTRTYFENLVRALENGLSDVDGVKQPAADKGKENDLSDVNAGEIFKQLAADKGT